MREFYVSLPTIEQYKDFYIKGYTEALKFYSGVRVIPDESYVVGSARKYLSYFSSVGSYPVYFIPVFNGECCYGFVLKAEAKMTPRVVSNCFMPGIERVVESDVVCLVEGIKDSYALLKVGLKTIPMCTSVPTEGLLQYLKSISVRVVFISDNDNRRKEHNESFIEKARKVGIGYKIFNLEDIEDLGELFDYSEDRIYSRAVARNVLKIKNMVSGVR